MSSWWDWKGRSWLNHLNISQKLWWIGTAEGTGEPQYTALCKTIPPLIYNIMRQLAHLEVCRQKCTFANWCWISKGVCKETGVQFEIEHSTTQQKNKRRCLLALQLRNDTGLRTQPWLGLRVTLQCLLWQRYLRETQVSGYAVYACVCVCVQVTLAARKFFFLLK